MSIREVCFGFVLAGSMLFFCGYLVSVGNEETAEEGRKVKVYGPRGIMDTSPVMVVPDEEEPEMSAEALEALAKIPLSERLAKYDVLAGDALRAGKMTPYFNGQILGKPENSPRNYRRYAPPFIWESSGPGAQRWQWKTSDYEPAHDFLRLIDRAEGSEELRPFWRTREIPVSPGGIYRLSVFASCDQQDGWLTAGTDFAGFRIREMKPLSDELRETRHMLNDGPLRYTTIFLTPETSDDVRVRLEAGKPGATCQISRVYLEPVIPIYRGVQSPEPLKVKVLAGESSFVGIPGKKPKNTENRGGDFLRLGDGEKIEKNQYAFEGTFGGQHGYFHRPFHKMAAKFDTDRLIFEKNAEVIYRFALQPIRVDEKPGEFLPPAVNFGECVFSLDWADAKKAGISVAYSTDGENWKEKTFAVAGKSDTPGSVPATINAKLNVKNAAAVYIRVRNAENTSFSVTRTALTAKTDSELYVGTGETIFAVLSQRDEYSDKKETPKECVSYPIMFGSDYGIYTLAINETGEAAGIPGGGGHDHGGSEDEEGIHGDGPGKWTFISIGGKWGPVAPHSAGIDISVYNWGGGYFTSGYAHFRMGYEIRSSVEVRERVEAYQKERLKKAWEKQAALEDENNPAGPRSDRLSSALTRVLDVPSAFKLMNSAEFGENLPAEVTEELVPGVEVLLPESTGGRDCTGVFSPDGKYFAYGYPLSHDLFTNIYDLQTGEWIFDEKEAISPDVRKSQMTFYHSAPVAFSPDSRFCAYVTHEGVVLWDMQEKKRHILLSGLLPQWGTELPAIRALRFSEDGKQLIARVGGSSIIGRNENDYVWDVAGGPPELFTGEENASAPGNQKIFSESDDLRGTKPLAYSSDGKIFTRLVERDWSSGLVVRDSGTGQEVCSIPLAGSLTAAAFLPGSHILVTAVSPAPGDRKPYSPGIQYPPMSRQMNPPVPANPTFALLEFWDISRLSWDKHQGSVFPKKIRACYFGRTRETTSASGKTQIAGMRISQIVPSPDGSRMYLGLESRIEVTRDGKRYRCPGYIVPVSTKKKSREMLMR